MLTQVQIEKIVFNLRLGKVAQRMSLNDVVMGLGTTYFSGQGLGKIRVLKNT